MKVILRRKNILVADRELYSKCSFFHNSLKNTMYNAIDEKAKTLLY